MIVGSASAADVGRQLGKLAVLIVSLLALLVGTLETKAAGILYRLGAEDKLRIYVHEWPALTGTFTIGANGTLSLPMIGELDASGLQTSELANAIAERLKKRAELVDLPNISVEVTQYRPFYILGGVERPGEYPYRPGMTVLNAVSIAGGVYRAREATGWTFERESIQAGGDLQVFAARRQELLMKQARLQAEAEGLNGVTFPTPERQADAHLASAFAEQERSIFEARLESYNNQVQTMHQTIRLYENEIEALGAQITTEESQIKAVQRELDDTRGMIARGLAPTPRVLPLEQTIAQIRREQKDHQTAIIRAKQRINEANQQLADLRDKRRGSAVEGIQSGQAQLNELTRRYQTAQRLLAGASSSFPDMRTPGSEPLATLGYSIVRAENGEAREMDATETTRVEPGDIVKVRLAKENLPENAASSHTSGALAVSGETRGQGR